MPVDLASPFRRLLSRIVTTSQEIRSSALEHANGQNFDTSERLRGQLETIRTSADTILQALAKATHTSYILDDRMTSWLASEEPHSCLSKLKDMNNILRPADDTEDFAPSFIAARDRLVAATVLFDTQKNLFHFLLTPGVWNCERLDLQSEAAPPNPIAVEHENGPRSAQTKTTDRKKELLHQKLAEISRWLTPMECTQKHKEALRLRQEGTCKWFPNTNAYERWRAPGNHFLWLHGKGGCGKAYTIDHLRIGLQEGEVVVFFYCDFQNKRSMSSTELMRSVLFQLLCHIRDCGVDPGVFPDKILQQKSEGTLSLDDLGKLCDLVSDAASFFRYEPMVIIDALDECADIETLLPALITLSQSFVRLLVTSRPDQTITDHFVGLRSLSFENVTEEIAADIALHVRRELDSHSRLRSAISKMKNEIDAKLIGKADGRFRWVQCQLDTLKRCTTKEELREALDSLPNELGATYERILGALDERKSEGELARRVLALLMAAIEPLQVTQIVDGLSMNFQKRQHDHETRRWLETKLLHSLSSLVSYHEETHVLALSHHSVKEYLTSCSALPMYQISFHQAHTEAVQICLQYISVFLKQESSRGDLELWSCFPMLSYVLSSGFNHLAYVDSESPVALEALQSLGSDVRHHPSHWDRLCELREEILEWPFTPWPSSKHDFVLYTLIAYSPPGLLQTFLSHSYPLQPRIRTNPLVYAADLRKTEHAMVLLAHSADVNLRGLVIDDSYRASPLEVAIDLADDMLVGELLTRGCLMASEVLSTAICMPWCSTQVLAKLMQTDEFAEWALGIGEEKLYRSVFNSARPNSGDSMKTDEDHVVLARRLRQLGLDLSAESQFGTELIERALNAAHISTLEFLLPPDEPPPAKFLIAALAGDSSETVPVVRFLLQKGVDVHAVSGQRRDTALHLAAMCPWKPRRLELTRLLIDAGCNFNALNSVGESPLVISMTRGHYAVVEVLLSRNAPLPSNILHVAFERCCNSRIIELLLHKGANVHAVSLSSGNTILHCVIIGRDEHGRERQESECHGLVKYFLKAGCDPTTRNPSGATALEMAMQRSLTSVVNLLISPGVPLPPDALLIAIRRSQTLEMVEYLIHRGADVHPTTHTRDTALHLALGRHCTEETRCKLVKKLINAGCDTLARNSSGETALEMAIQRSLTSVVNLLIFPGVPLPPNALLIAIQRRSTLEMVEYLIHRGANVYPTTRNRDTILHLALGRHCTEETRCKLAKKLINAGCDTLARNSSGETALEMAIQRSLTSVVNLLISPGVPLPPNALLIAIQRRSTLEMVEYLIHNGADVHSITSDGDTVLHLALNRFRDSEETCYRLVKMLINAGCDTTGQNAAGKTALEIAIRCNFTSVVELLCSDVPLLHDALLIAVRQGWTFKMIEYLIRKGADVCSTTSDGDAVIHLALKKSYFDKTCCDLVKRLINAGCDTTVHDSSGKTPLELAMQRNFTSVAELLLPSDTLPRDVLLIAVRQFSTLEMVEFLIQRGADLHSTTSNGDTILHLVLATYHTEEEHCKFVQCLINAGCDPSTCNSKGNTALLDAMERGYSSVVKLLLSLNVPIPSDIVHTALQRRCEPRTIDVLMHNGANNVSGSDWETLLQLACTAYSGQYSRQVTEILEVARKACRTHPNLEDETCMPVAKRLRLEEQE